MKNDFQPVVGHRFNFRSTPVPNWNGVIDGEVLVVEPNSRLSYSWGSMGLVSVVAWTLTPAKGGTLVRMEQTGFRSEEDANYKGANYGWKKFIGSLERVAGGWTDHEGKKHCLLDYDRTRIYRRSSRRRIPQLSEAADVFRATAARIRVFRAFSLILSPSWKSMARLTRPSRLELKRPEGSSNEAPLANVIFTTFL